MNLNLTNASILQNVSSAKCVRDTSITKVIFPCLYMLLAIASIFLNSLMAWIFFKIPSKSTFIVYLKNVMVADLIMTVTIIIKAVSDAELGQYYLKAFVCRYSAVLFYMMMYVSIILLGLISLDRFLKIVRPFGRSFIRKATFGKYFTITLWALMFFITALPNMVFTNKKPTPFLARKCSLLKGQFGLQWHEAINYICQVIFWTVFGLMTVCYTLISKKVYDSYRNSQGTNKNATVLVKLRVFVVVAVFFICFAPFHFNRIPYTLSQTGKVSNCHMQNSLYITKETTLWLSATNVCLDPIMYVLLCKSFQKKVPDAIRKVCRCLPFQPPESSFTEDVEATTV
ncbi:P2Y purinoceptor 13-like [Polypterus senegalus]|nr:P2Y purinoceptor 13-like [Polypterus senegalus]XP_039613876.1 P2Y purinoceptor 13-like [Polypterus senegalus]